MLVAPFTTGVSLFRGDCLPLALVGESGLAVVPFSNAFGGVVGRTSEIWTGGRVAPGEEMRGSIIGAERRACCAI